MSAAGAAGGGVTNVEQVFQTHLYKGNGSQNLTVTNGIDLAGEGGMVWYRRRDATENNSIEDTVRGLDNVIYTDSTNAEADPGAYGLQAFNSNGFTAGYDTSGGDYVSWTFRKAKGFFDIQTYSGNSSNRTISHNLGSVPGCILIKRTNRSGDWAVYHRGINSNSSPEDYFMYLDSTTQPSNNHRWWNDTAPTSTNFSLGTSADVNGSGDTYVAYIFAHNDGDGTFGKDGNEDIIKCGYYNGNDTVNEINIGFEPQWVLLKATGSSLSDPYTAWHVLDTIRGAPHVNYKANFLFANKNSAEASGYGNWRPTPTGFKLMDGAQADNSSSSSPYIYVAIRRGPMAAPTDATDVFDIDINTANTDPTWSHPFPVDFAFYKHLDNVEDWVQSARLIQTQPYKFNNQTFSGSSSAYAFDYMDGWFTSGTTDNYASWAWRRAPQFFDVCTFDGTSSNRTVTHNLEAVPEMIWVRTLGQNAPFAVYHKDAGADHVLFTHTTAAKSNSTAYFNSTTPTSSVFSLGTNANVNYSAYSYIAYLFASLDGISKVGSYTGTGSAQNIDCGFSVGARFILIKRLDSGSDWFLFDTVRGIQTGTDDKMLHINDDDAEFHSFDYVNPSSNGFAVGSIASINASGGTFAFYAIA